MNQSFVPIVLFMAMLCSYSCDAINNEKSSSREEIQQDIMSAENTLKHYLSARSAGQFYECEKLLTRDYLGRFKKSYGTNYADYFRNQSEDYYKNPRIIDSEPRDDEGVVIKVSTEVHGPGYINDAIERYYMIKESGVWKVNDWQVEYKKNSSQ